MKNKLSSQLNPYRWLILTVIVVLVSLACQSVIPDNEPEDPGKILFKDNFSDEESGWNRVLTASGETNYADGVYRIYVDEPNLDIWAKPNLKFNDVRIEVDALKVGGDRDNRFGIICRAIEPESFYTFIISSDGYYGVGKIKGQQYSLIGMDTLQKSDAIKLGSALNHIRADCVGDELILYVNGQKLIKVQDGEYSEGDVGLIAGTYEIPGTDIRFDNFIVYGK